MLRWLNDFSTHVSATRPLPRFPWPCAVTTALWMAQLEQPGWRSSSPTSRTPLACSCKEEKAILLYRSVCVCLEAPEDTLLPPLAPLLYQFVSIPVWTPVPSPTPLVSNTTLPKLRCSSVSLSVIWSPFVKISAFLKFEWGVQSNYRRGLVSCSWWKCLQISPWFHYI